MFKLGDRVIVRRLARFSNDNIRGGWTGVCQADQYSDEIGSLVNVEWDEATLDRIRPEYKVRCKAINANYRCFHIPTNQLFHDKGSEG